MTSRRWAVLAVAAVALFLILGRVITGFIADYQWYAALGASAMWRTKTLTTLGLRLTSGVLAAAFVFANLYGVRHSVVSLVLPRRVANIEIGEEIPGTYLVAAAAVLAILLGALLTLPSNTWMSWVLAHHGIPFNESDPYFEADLGFYVYWLPFETAIYLWALIAVMVVAAVVIFLYALTPSLRWERGSLYVSHYVRRHLVVLCCLLLLLMAWRYRLDAYRVLFAGSGPDGLFTFTDHRAGIPVSLWMSIATVAAAFVVLFFGWTGQLRVAVTALGALLVVAFGAREIAPVIARHFAPVADADLRERPYRQVRVDYTRRAYALDRIERSDSLVFPSADGAAGTVPVWDPLPLEQSLERGHEVEGIAHGVGWSATPLGLTAVVVTGPSQEGELLDAAGSPAAPREVSWSATRVRASMSDDNGDPVLGAPGSSTAARPLPPVLVYDSVPGYALVFDSTGTIAAPALDDAFDRIVQAWSQQNLRLLSLDRPGVRMLTRRSVQERIGAVAPFFVQGTSVLPVVADDSLYWTVALYDASADYPLSKRVTVGDDEYGLVRHAATAIVNAHTGRVLLLADVTVGPIAQTWMREFPSLFASPDRLSAALLAALPPPVDGVTIQADLLARFGLSGDSSWMGHLPSNGGEDSVFRDGSALLFATGRGRLGCSQAVLDSTDRLAGAVLGTGGRTGTVYWVPLQPRGPRWNTSLDEMRHALDSTATIPRDARIRIGEVRVVPLAHGLALVMPAYVWKSDVPPTVARVAVARDTLVTTGRTLAEALGVAAAAPADTVPLTPGDFRARVRELYDRMHIALQRGDWVAFGRAYDALGQLLLKAAP
ncbi:MAG TPA: UPF0182 family protein [Gemmatimonadaceae bacterium]|nr:UPF0182 family protein [Gemmatimonadaceae bacterium]